jgi:hypothetical protein
MENMEGLNKSMGIILGIDVGCGKRSCAFSVVSNGQLIAHKTVDGSDAIFTFWTFEKKYNFKKCVIEIPREGIIYAKHLINKSGGPLSVGERNTIAMHVGQNIQLAKELIREARRIGIKVFEEHPKRSNTKWPLIKWKLVFNYPDRRPPSSHARDASVIALLYENVE